MHYSLFQISQQMNEGLECSHMLTGCFNLTHTLAGESAVACVRSTHPHVMANLTEAVHHFMNHPALLSYYLCDDVKMGTRESPYPLSQLGFLNHHVEG